MTKPFMDLSFTFAMDLYRVKCAAENRGDKASLTSLEKAYPELFTDEFQEFIESVKITVAYIDEKHDQDFSSHLFPNLATQAHKLN